MRISAKCVCLVLAVAWACASSSAAEVVFERKMAPEELKRYELLRLQMYPKGAQTEEEMMRKVEDAKKDETVLKIEVVRHEGRPLPQVWLTVLYRDITKTEVLFERRLDPETLKRWEVTHSTFVLPANVTTQQIQDRAEKLKKDEKVVRVELFGDLHEANRPQLRTFCLGKDLVMEAKENEWGEYAMRNLACAKDFAGFTHEGSTPSLIQGYIFFDEWGDVGCLVERYHDSRDRVVDVLVYEAKEWVITPHQFLRLAIREDCRVKKTKTGYLIQSEDRWGKTTAGGSGRSVSWMSGDHRAVYITGVGVDAEGLVPLYASKFPSTLPRDFKIDKTAWGREEMEFWLEKMKKAAELANEKLRQQRLKNAFTQIRSYICAPVILGAEKYDAPVELLEDQYDLLVKWWEEDKDNTYWHEKMQQLVAKGQTPEELAAAARKREEEARKAILDAPLTDEKIKQITQKLIETFERSMQRSDVEFKIRVFGPECQARFEKVADGGWKLEWTDTRRGEKEQETYTGPELKARKRDKRCPLEGIFTRRYSDPIDKKERSALLVYYYDKLQDKWGRTKPDDR